MVLLFHDRKDAGKQLGKALSFLKGKEGVVVLAIPRGGLPVAREVAAAIGAPLDIVVTRKIGAPGNPELAIGAVTEEGETIRDEGLIQMLGVSDEYLTWEAARQVDEIKERERKYRGARAKPDLKGKTVVIVDDGIATGSTIRAAVASVRKREASTVVVATPVGPPDAVSQLEKSVDRVVCLSTPEYLEAIGEFYEEFEQVDDDTVRKILGRKGVKTK